MSDNFYDFDKDDAFDEVYLKKSSAPPRKKEFEIEIPMPESGVKSTMPQQQNKQPQPVKEQAKKAVPKKKKLSPTALTLIIIGMIVSCILVFAGSFIATIFGWNYIPSLDKPSQEDSVVDDIEQIEEYVEISDDGSYVEVVPMYRETAGDDAPPSQSTSDDDADTDSEDTDSENSDNTDSENNVEEETSSGEESSSSDEEIITI